MAEPRKTVDAFVAAHTANDLDALRATLADDFRMRTALGLLGPRDYVEFVQAVAKGIPDFEMLSEFVSAEGNVVEQTFGVRGTHTATFDLGAPGMKPLPATGRQVGIAPGLLRFTVVDGRIVRAENKPGEEGAVVDFLRQMGAKLPPLWVARFVNRIARRYERR